MSEQSTQEKSELIIAEDKINIDVESNNLEILKHIETNEHEHNEVIEINNKNNENNKTLENKDRTKSNHRILETEKNDYGYYGVENSREKQNSPYTRTVWVELAGFGRENMAPSEGIPLDYEPESRNSFVKFVFLIVLIMLLCTVGFNVFVLLTEDVRNLFESLGLILLLPALIIMLAVNYAMVCSTCARVTPCNIVCLCMAVAAMSVITAYFTVKYETRLVLYAILATVCTVIVCILLACSKFDFTKWILYVALIGVAVTAVSMMILISWLATGTYYKPLHIVILLVGTVLNVVVLVIELQTILGGRAVELSENDYALAAFMLYTSIVDLFIKMLQLAGLFDT
ncbi:uncharacterized protein LOC113510539 [Galleria mellonella]|uniref:Uncharacterized protein LOC113510539 n=1 Tax=Galleria mellonella TaxID=7137 RepID=A0A6J3C456_GALME|nr:uncharacterized protein LOC113510539 [Galleria mellonella]